MPSSETPAASSLFLSTRGSRQVDGALVQVRWILALLAWVIAAIGAGTPSLGVLMVVWLSLLILFNLALFVLVRSQRIPPSLPLWGTLGDGFFFGLLPYLSPANGSILFLFALYPAVVAALRYGPGAAALLAVVLTLPYEALALASLLPEPIRLRLPFTPADANLVAASLPVVALFAVIILVGYLAQREREAVGLETSVELEQLRRGIANTKLLYQSSDTLTQTLNYSQVLEAMLEAGTAGMPTVRREEGPAVGVVLFFEENDPEKHLKVTAWRNIDRSDAKTRIPGKEGVVAQALDRGEPVTFVRAGADPELGCFASFRHCKAGVCLPLQAGLSQYGVVVLASPAARLPSELHLSLMRAFTNQAAVAFQNAQLYQRLREERDHIIDAEAGARAKLARDLHDGPTQTLAALAMRLDYIHTLLERDPDKAKAELILARQSAIQSGKELRELLFTLRPLTLETQGLSATLKLWAQKLSEVEHLALDLDPGNVGPEVDPKLAGAVFSIIEEAVNNARKHGGGAPIHVRVGQQGESLVATVQDEGPGFDVAAVENSYDERGSLGLVNMRERAKLLDGHLSLDSAPGRGTRVLLIVPLGERTT